MSDCGLLSEEAGGTGALSGLRVLDLTKFWAGPAVTEALGNMGAQVVKVEAAHALDPWRLGGARQTVEPSEDGPTYEFSSIFNAVNRNKYGLTLDLSQPRGREILKQLLVTTDLLAENYAPRVMTKFGLGYESLRQINPRLVMISLPAFGSSGPWRDYVGFAYPTEQAAGFPHFTGYTDGEPMLWGCAAGDAIAGMLGLVGVLAAVNWARETGEGQHVDVSQVEALSTFLGPSMIDYSWHRRSWPRRGNADPTRAPQGCYPTGGNDTWMVVSAEDDEQWRALCRVLHRDDWLGRADLDVRGRPQRGPRRTRRRDRALDIESRGPGSLGGTTGRRSRGRAGDGRVRSAGRSAPGRAPLYRVDRSRARRNAGAYRNVGEVLPHAGHHPPTGTHPRTAQSAGSHRTARPVVG